MTELIDVFQTFRKILCVCPCCNQIVRLSDLHLKYGGRAPKTWFDKHELQLLRLQEKVATFEEKEKELREQSVERGRKKVPSIVKKCLCSEFRKLEYDPYDIKAIMDPVDFVVFDGLNEGEKVRKVTFLTRRPSPSMRTITESIGKTVKQGNYDWKVARINTSGKVSLE